MFEFLFNTKILLTCKSSLVRHLSCIFFQFLCFF
uniref:Uncharacterized protein n=1 Tax=Rhizophora mucronata TaxID=61149 RepID=A0A2P2Q049_RHIMU